jgi:hypothetical protein
MMNSEMAGSGWVGHWSPGIGDPTLMGWLTVALYAVGVWQCYRVVATHNGRIPRSELMIWWLMVFGFLALGINKQLDLQVLSELRTDPGLQDVQVVVFPAQVAQDGSQLRQTAFD